MAQYLRYIAHHFTDADGRPDKGLAAAVRAAPETWHLGWMYQHLATPLRTDGVAKVNIFFTAAELGRAPTEVLGIADVYQSFDAAQFLAQEPEARQHYFLERFHTALLRCADHFGWDSCPFEAARQQVLEENFQFSFLWKKPLASPDRRRKVQALINASPFPTRIYLVFFDQRMQELRRTLLSVGTDGPGAVEFALGRIRWANPEAVVVQHRNERDYWLCTTDGRLEFHYPRAESGDPHGQYDLGRMYYDGQWVLQDQERGLALIRAAADAGFQHAIRFLTRLHSDSGAERPQHR